MIRFAVLRRRAFHSSPPLLFALKLLFFALLAWISLSGLSSAATKVDYGADFRFRYEYWKGVIDMGSLNLDDEDYFRLKASVWSKVDYNNLGLYAKVSSEPKYYISSNSVDNRDFEQDEIFFESLFVDIRKPGGFPVNFRIGRQDLRYGDGFLIADGSPSSADRANFFNAIKATWNITDANSIDVVYIYDRKIDDILPVVHPAKTGRFYQDHQRILNSSNEQGVVVYGRNTVGENLLLEPYYIFKREEKIDTNNPQLDLHTLGGRVVYKWDQWRFKGEYAHQFGEYEGGKDRRADGGNASLSRTFETTLWKPEVVAGYVHLSGDNQNTATNEGWDPLFSRYMWMSALYKYSFTREIGIGSYWTNLSMYRINGTLTFSPDTNLTVAYNYLRANETTKVTGQNAPVFSNSGKDRGHLPQASLAHKFSKNLSSLLRFEYFVPRNFYRNTASDAFYLSLMMQLEL